MGGVTLGFEAVKFGGSFDCNGDGTACNLTDDSSSVFEGTKRSLRRDANMLSLRLQAPRSDDWTELSMAGACERSGTTAFAIVCLTAAEEDMYCWASRAVMASCPCLLVNVTS